MPGDAKLDWLHAVLQVTIGWTNSHLHQFKVGEICYSDTRHHSAEFEDDQKILEERKFDLRQIAPREQDVILYEYDFGDSWDHEITVEKTNLWLRKLKWPRVTEAQLRKVLIARDTVHD